MVRQAIAFAVVLGGTAAHAHWQPQYAQVSPVMQQWFQGLKSPRGIPCCDTADGHRLDDADVRNDGGRWQVRIGGVWRDVVEEQTLSVPNKFGQPIVWYMGTEFDPRITCFLPGAGL
jgi:glucose dehydrogenase